MTARYVHFTLLLLGTAASIVLLWFTEIPLGVPEDPLGMSKEWTWPRIFVEANQTTDLLLGLCMATVAGALYIGFAILGARRMAVCNGVETTGWMIGLVAAAFLWLCAVQNSPPGEQPHLKSTWVLYDPGSSGYFFEASHRIDNLSEFLSGYEERMTQGDVLHVGTHPPGLFLFHYGLIQLCRSSPEFSRMILQTQPQSVADTFTQVERQFDSVSPPLPATDRAALWLASFFTQLLGVATVVPLFLLLNRDSPRQTCWKVVVLWPLVPALAIFLPKSDALYPFLGMLFLWMWLEGKSRGSVLLCLSAGFLFWLGLFLSLAMLPIALLAVLMTAWEYRFRHEMEEINGRDRNLILSIVSAASGFLIPVFILWLACDVNLFKVWLWNYRNHAAFYDQFSRTYWKWLFVNPLELAIAVGVPVSITFVVSLLRTVRAEKNRPSRIGPYWCCLLVWGILWLSGKNMGEAARLWLFLMPWFVWLTAASLNDCGKKQMKTELSPGSPHRLDDWSGLLVLQTVVCIATVSRVSGFHFGTF